jgi:hypothetical protein
MYCLLCRVPHYSHNNLKTKTEANRVSVGYCGLKQGAGTNNSKECFLRRFSLYIMFIFVPDTASYIRG